jgi:protein subunit release factor A
MDFKPHKSYTKPLAQIEKKMSEKETEVEKNEEIEKNIENVQSIFNSFNENLSSVKIYFSKFGNLASGEDENIKESSDTFFKEVFADMKKTKKELSIQILKRKKN